MLCFSNPKQPNHDVVQRVVADVRHASGLLAALVATSTVLLSSARNVKI